MNKNEVDDVAMLKKAEALCLANLAELRSGDIMNLKDDLWEFTGRGYTMDESKDDFIKRLSLEQLTEVQKAFQISFGELADGDTTADGRIMLVWRVDGPKAHIVAQASGKAQPFNYGVFTTNLVDAAMISLVNHVARSGATPEQFRRCPECNAAFFLVRKPDNRNFYCTRTCSLRVVSRNFMRKKRQKAKDAKRTRSEQRDEAIKGNVSVSRRKNRVKQLRSRKEG